MHCNHFCRFVSGFDSVSARAPMPHSQLSFKNNRHSFSIIRFEWLSFPSLFYTTIFLCLFVSSQIKRHINIVKHVILGIMLWKNTFFTKRNCSTQTRVSLFKHAVTSNVTKCLGKSMTKHGLLLLSPDSAWQGWSSFFLFLSGPHSWVTLAPRERQRGKMI